MYERSIVNVKFEPRSTSRVSLTIFYLAFICIYTSKIYVRYVKITRQWKDTKGAFDWEIRSLNLDFPIERENFTSEKSVLRVDFN